MGAVIKSMPALRPWGEISKGRSRSFSKDLLMRLRVDASEMTDALETGVGSRERRYTGTRRTDDVDCEGIA